MDFFARMNPLRAVRDLRLFLMQRQPHELWFLLAAIVLTTLLIAGFAHDSTEPRPYKRDIVYVQQWRADRSDSEIRAQQAIDEPIKQKAIAEQRAREKALQAQFKKVDDRLNSWGL